MPDDVEFQMERDINYSPDKVIFFPDDKLPCLRDEFRTNTRFSRCPKKHSCNDRHADEAPTGLMKMMDLLRNCQVSLDICVFCITLERLSTIVVDLHRRNVRVRIITDNGKRHDQIEKKKNQIPMLMKNGIRVKTNIEDDNSKDQGLMHCKYAILDNKTILEGSFNWTFNAVTKNFEHLNVITQPNLVESYKRQFESMWRSLPNMPQPAC